MDRGATRAGADLQATVPARRRWLYTRNWSSVTPVLTWRGAAALERARGARCTLRMHARAPHAGP